MGALVLMNFLHFFAIFRNDKSLQSHASQLILAHCSTYMLRMTLTLALKDLEMRKYCQKQPFMFQFAIIWVTLSLPGFFSTKSGLTLTLKTPEMFKYCQIRFDCNFQFFTKLYRHWENRIRCFWKYFEYIFTGVSLPLDQS